VVVALTAYFSTERTPPCLVSGAPAWHAPTGSGTQRFLLVVPDRALCFYAIDEEHVLAGTVKLRGIEGIDAIAPRGDKLAIRYRGGRGALVDLASGRTTPAPPPPRPAPGVTVADPKVGVEYRTRPGELGFRVVASDGTSRTIRFPGFAWNPRFGPDPPDHGLAFFPRRRQLWVLDAPNSVAHVYDVSGVPAAPPHHVDDVRFSKPLSGDEDPCAHPRCGRLGSLLGGSDGRYLYVGDAGDVIDVTRREQLLNLEAMHQSRLMIEVDWIDGKPTFPR
jgi:hypothetical protein